MDELTRLVYAKLNEQRPGELSLFGVLCIVALAALAILLVWLNPGLVL